MPSRYTLPVPFAQLQMVPQDEALCQEVSSNLGRLDYEGE